MFFTDLSTKKEQVKLFEDLFSKIYNFRDSYGSYNEYTPINYPTDTVTAADRATFAFKNIALLHTSNGDVDVAYMRAGLAYVQGFIDKLKAEDEGRLEGVGSGPGRITKEHGITKEWMEQRINALLSVLPDVPEEELRKIKEDLDSSVKILDEASQEKCVIS